MKGRKYFLARRLVVRFIGLVVIVTMLAGCNDPLLQQSHSGTPATGGVPVSVSIGLADGDEFTATPSTRSSAKGAMEVKLQSAATTRAGTDYKPDKLYYLEVQQYKQDGTRLQNNILVNTAITVGSLLELTLTPTVNDEYCQLVIVARGETGMMPTLKDKNLSDVQQNISVTAANINSIAYTADDIKKMPYVLHLKQVKVTSVDGKYVIQSPEGAFDTRLMLKRLAARLNVTWDYQVTDYILNQLWIQDIPLNYSVVDTPDEQGSYPSLVSQFTTLQVPLTDQRGTYSCWVPANVRGEKAEASSDLLRTKANAPQGSSYFNFIATHTSDARKKLYYRVYIGNGLPKDFNLNRNKDYVYTVNFNHQGIPTNDGRVTFIDPISASQNNDNLVPTANCFMVEPGGAFCFDPFTFRQNGTDITNTTLTGWANSARGGIASVKVLWQTKESGDVGDPILGIVDSETDHTNVVDIKRTDGQNIATNPATASGQCRIYCRVAANTTGGNGVIAAYDQNGAILWSWHIWVTDYSPDASGNATVLEPTTKRKQKYAFHPSREQLPMMDRNLGALAGYTEVPATELDRSRTNGMHYQWGRKDPFPGSFTSEMIQKITIASGATFPTYGLLNAYGPDGYTFRPRLTADTNTSIENASKNPTTTYLKRPWYSSNAQYWADGTAKTIYDPCPPGWKVPQIEDYTHFFSTISYGTDLRSDNATLRSKPESSDGNYWKKGDGAGVWNDGGVVLYYDTDNAHTTYFRFTGYQEYVYEFNYIGRFFCVWCGNHEGLDGAGFSVNWAGLPYQAATTIYTRMLYKKWASSDVQNVRCIQERAD